MFDRDILRNQQLIEEREIYENNFISIEDIIKSDEMDYYNCPQYENYISGTFEIEDIPCDNFNVDLEFDLDDYLDQLRDEQLIEERQAYEIQYFSRIPEEAVQSDALDILTDSFEKIFCCPDYDDYYEDFYFEEYNMDAAYCGNRLFGYIVDDNESFEEFDYPEGPDENLCGFRYPEPDYFEDPCFDFPGELYNFPEDFCDYPEPDYEIEYYIPADLCESEESHMQDLIKEHIAEENAFFEFISNQEIPEEYLPPEVAGDIIIL